MPQEIYESMILKKKLVLKALERFRAIVESQDCECDSYNGYVCTVHADLALAGNAIRHLNDLTEMLNNF